MNKDTSDLFANLYSSLAMLLEEIDKFPANTFMKNGEEEFHKFLATTHIARESLAAINEVIGNE